MSVWLDQKYIGMVSYKLERFKRQGEYSYNFRCPICGDSRKDKSKMRGYFYKKKDSMFFYCHNCNEGMFFGKFLKRIDSNLHRQYSLEQFADSPAKPKVSAEEEAKPFVTSPVFLTKEKIHLPSIESLPFDHFAKKYILSRKLPKEFLADIYYSSCFKSFLDEMLPGNEKNIPLLEKRVVIPFYDEKQNLLGFQEKFSVWIKLTSANQYMLLKVLLIVSSSITQSQQWTLHCFALQKSWDKTMSMFSFMTMKSGTHRFARIWKRQSN